MRSGRFVLAALVLGLVLATVGNRDWLSAQTTPAKIGAPKGSSDDEKKISFAFRNETWDKVLNWLGEQTGLTKHAPHGEPTGTVTILPPRGMKFSVPEVFDILNEHLAGKKWVLLRGRTTFTVWPADVKIPPELVPRVDEEELKKRGDSEVVSIVVRLETILVDVFAPQAKKMLGTFGEVVPLSQSNHILIQGKAREVRDVVQVIHDLEKSQNRTFIHRCQWVKARLVAQKLKELLPKAELEKKDAATVFAAQVTWSDATQTVYVVGSPSMVARAKLIVKFLDQKVNGAQPLPGGNPVIKRYDLLTDAAEEVAKQLQEIYKDATNVKIFKAGPRTVMAYAPPADQEDIARMLKGSKEPQAPVRKMAAVQLVSQDAEKVAETLKGMFGATDKGGPYVEADTAQNRIIIHGTPQQVAEATEVLKGIDPLIGKPGVGGRRTIIIEKGSTRILATELGKMLKAMGRDVRIIIPGQPSPKPPQPEPKPQKQSRAPNRQSPIAIEFCLASDEQPTAKQPGKAKGNGEKKKGRITITAIGNRLEVQADNPEDLLMIQRMVQIYTSADATSGEFHVLRLKNADAVEVAEVLDEVFNGPKKQSGGSSRGGSSSRGGFNPFSFFTRLAGNVANMPTSGTENRIRVVAHPPTNSLLVKASPLDLATIKELLGEALDVSTVDSKAVLRNWRIGPLQYADANDIAEIISDIYKENMKSSSQSSSSTPRFPFPFPIRRSSDSGSKRGSGKVELTVGVDDRTNTLVLRCSELMYKDIKQLVEELEEAASKATTVVEVVPLPPGSVDPKLIEQAINAVQGNPVTTSRSSGSRGFSPFSRGGFPSSRFGGFSSRFGGGLPFGGFRPGGFGFGGFRPPFGRTSGSSGRSRSSGRSSSGRGFGSRSSSGRPQQQSRGPDFFAPPVKDDRRIADFYDPRETPGVAFAQRRNRSNNTSGVNEVQYTGHRGDPPKEAGRGPDFFESPVKDDRRDADFVDPRHRGNQESKVIRPAAHAQPGQPPAGQPSGEITGPRGSATVVALEELGVLVIRAANKKDLDEILKIVKLVQDLGKGAVVDFELVTLQYGDATVISDTLNRLYQQVRLGASATTTTGGPQQQPGFPFGQAQQLQAEGPIVLLPIPRLNSILVAGPKQRIPDVRRQIAQFDKKNSAQLNAMPFRLKSYPASRMASLITSFFTQRYPGEEQNQIRVTADEQTNTVFVQASPADLRDIGMLIEQIDNGVSSAVSDLKIVTLKYANATELATLIARSITEGVAQPSAVAPGVFPAPPGQQPGAVPGQLPGIGQQPGAVPGTTTTTVTKTSTLRFFSSAGKVVQTGILSDVRIYPDVRTNALVIAAPEKTMALVMALIRDLDQPPAARSEINVHTLKKADASAVAAMLQQLFLGTGTTGQQPAVPGAPGQVPGAPGQVPSGTRPLVPAVGQPAAGAGQVEVRITVDARTNSIIVAGTPSDLDVIEAIISRLEDSPVEERRSQIYRLKNAIAADVAAAINDFLAQSNAINQSSPVFFPQFEQLRRQVIVVPEPISNTLLISATPQRFDEIMKLIVQLDQLPPQVVIQALIAEVTIDDLDEFGVEIGFQSPVLFDRSLVPGGVVLNNISQVGVPGFNFNDVTVPLGNSTVAGRSVVGVQGLGNFGVGRISPNASVGGFVFSAASDSVSILVRALRTQGRLDVLSRPQLMTSDNQAAFLQVGQDFPFITNSFVTVTTGIPVTTNTIAYRPIGVIMEVVPKINPDGTIVMRVKPQISSVSDTTIPITQGTFATAFNVQTVETTVIAQDGETIVLGGLIQTTNEKNENKVPWLGDLPGVGALFRYRTQQKKKQELLIILTPHIVRCRADADRILAEESRRIDWILGDVLRRHGTYGMEPIMPDYVAPPARTHHPLPSPYARPPGPIPGGPEPANGAAPLHMPQPLPTPNSQAPTANHPVVNERVLVPQQDPFAGGASKLPQLPGPGTQEAPTPPRVRQPTDSQGRETQAWQLFRKSS